MADACHAGAATRENKRRDGFECLEPGAIGPRLRRAGYRCGGLYGLHGAHFSVENAAWGHGAFTKALLDGLRGAADYEKDDMLHFLELASYVSRAVPKLTNNSQHPTVHAPETVPDYPIAVLK